MRRPLPPEDPRRYLAGWIDFERLQAGPDLPQVDWRQEWLEGMISRYQVLEGQ